MWYSWFLTVRRFWKEMLHFKWSFHDRFRDTTKLSLKKETHFSIVTLPVFADRFGFNKCSRISPFIVSIQSTTPTQIQNRRVLLPCFRIIFHWWSKGVCSEFQNHLDLVHLVMIFQHLEVFFNLATTQFRSSHNQVGVRAKDKKWGTVREGKFGGIIYLLCFGNIAIIPTLFHCWNLISCL
jgi:hypothetical protein